MKKAKKASTLDIIKLSRQQDRAERIANGTYMPRGSVHDKPSRKAKRLDAKFKAAIND